MAKTRVHELAKEFGVESKFVLEKLKEMGEFVKSPSSTVELPVEMRFKKEYGEKLKAAAAVLRQLPPPQLPPPQFRRRVRPLKRPRPPRPPRSALPSPLLRRPRSRRQLPMPVRRDPARSLLPSPPPCSTSSAASPLPRRRCSRPPAHRLAPVRLGPATTRSLRARAWDAGPPPVPSGSPRSAISARRVPRRAATACLDPIPR